MPYDYSDSNLNALETDRGLPPGLLSTVKHLETGSIKNPENAVSPKGAIGPMQVMPATAASPGYGVKGGRDPRDPELAADYVSALYKKTGGNVAKTLAAYNAGLGGNPNNPETSKYVKNGIDHYEKNAPVTVNIPGGQQVRFPAGTSREVMTKALNDYMAKQNAPADPGGGRMPPVKQPENGAMRQIGLGARNIAEGAASSLGVISDPFTALANKVTGSKVPGLESATGNLLDRIGLPKSLSDSEKSAGKVQNFLSGLVTPIPGIGLLAKEGDAALKAGKEGAEAIAKEVGTAAPEQMSKMRQWAENFAAWSHGGREHVKELLGSRHEAAKQTIAKLANNVHNAKNDEQVGTIIKHALTSEEGWMGKSKALESKLYDKLAEYQPVKVAPKETAKTLTELTESIPGQVTGNTEMKGYAQRMAQALKKSRGTFDYDTLKALRTSVGEHINDSMLTSNTSQATWKKLYASLSQDMEKSIAGTNNPKALQAWDRANAFHGARQDKISSFIQPLTKGYPEQIMQHAFDQTRLGSSKVRELMTSLRPEQRGLVRSSFMNKLGKTPDDTFSFNKYISDWQKINPQVKDSLFGGPSHAIRKSLDKIANESAHNQALETAFNRHGEAQHARTVLGHMGHFLGGVGGFAMGGPVGGGVGLAGQYGLERALGRYLNKGGFANPKFIQWLAKHGSEHWDAIAQPGSKMKPAVLELQKIVSENN